MGVAMLTDPSADSNAELMRVSGRCAMSRADGAAAVRRFVARAENVKPEPSAGSAIVIANGESCPPGVGNRLGVSG